MFTFWKVAIIPIRRAGSRQRVAEIGDGAGLIVRRPLFDRQQLVHRRPRFERLQEPGHRHARPIPSQLGGVGAEPQLKCLSGDRAEVIDHRAPAGIGLDKVRADIGNHPDRDGQDDPVEVPAILQHGDVALAGVRPDRFEVGARIGRLGQIGLRRKARKPAHFD